MTRKERWEITKIIFDIIAILSAAVWAIFTFNLKDRPALALRRRAESTLSWKHKASDSIHAEFYVTLTNTGSSSFYLSKARLRAWTFDYKDMDQGKPIRYLDLNRIVQHGNRVFDTTFQYRPENDTFIGAPFIQKYDEGAEWSDNFDFTLPVNRKNLAFFLIQFYKENTDTAFDWTYAWGSIDSADKCKSE